MFIAWPGAPILLLYPFCFIDPVSGRRVRARYVAERHELENDMQKLKIIGRPEIRCVCSDTTGLFGPFH
jgi:hypothetical protein